MRRQSGMSQADAGQTRLGQNRLTRRGRWLSPWLSSLVIAGWMVVLAAPCQAQEEGPEPETPEFACAVAPVYPATETILCEVSVAELTPCCDCTWTEAPELSTCDPYDPGNPPPPPTSETTVHPCPPRVGDCTAIPVQGYLTTPFCGNPLSEAMTLPLITDAVTEGPAIENCGECDSMGSCSAGTCSTSRDLLKSNAYWNYAPPIAVNRYLMPSNQVDAFAFGRGMASDFDFRVTFYPNTTAGDVALLVDPQLGRVQYLTDANLSLRTPSKTIRPCNGNWTR